MGKYPELEEQLKVDEQSGRAALLTEDWRAASRFPSYAVSSFGRIRSIAGGQGRRAGVVLSGSVQTKNGYKRVRVTLREHGKTHYVFLHRVILESFLGCAPEGHECCHRDGDALNNALTNLYWGTRKQNQADSAAHGTKKNPPVYCGDSSPVAKVSDAAVEEMRSGCRNGESRRAAAEANGISVRHVGRILLGQSRRSAHV